MTAISPRKVRAPRSISRTLTLTLSTVVVSLWGLLGAFPLYWAITTSLKPGSSVVQLPPEVIPTNLTLENWIQLLSTPNVPFWLLNSIVVSTAVALGNVVFGTVAGYSFAKGQFAGKRVLFGIVILTLLFSSQVLMVPQFIIMRELGLLNTYWALILPTLVTPFSVFLTKQFMETIPDEIFDAARVDGASEYRIVASIALPLARPVIALVAVFSFLTTWSEYIYPLVMVSDSRMYTLALGLNVIQSQFALNFGLLMAAAVLTTIPPLVLFLVMQRHLVEGITMGGVK